MRFAVIMAGGSGTRFWPESTRALPKQFLTLSGDTSLIRATFDRISSLVEPERILVVTSGSHAHLVASEIPEIPTENILSEPVGRNTGPCLLLAAEVIAKRDPNASMLVVPADHLIRDAALFNSTLAKAFDRAESKETLVTLGLQPSYAATGYGYIKLGDELAAEVFQVDRFVEKPDLELAKEFINSGSFLWNSGMFIWRCSVFISSAKENMPEVYEAFDSLRTQAAIVQEDIDRVYETCPSISVDYGVMQGADNVTVVRATFDWSDVGDWRAVYDLAEKDESGNAGGDQSLFVETKNSLTRSSKKPVIVVGLEGIAVIETEKAILVCDINNSQHVKTAVEKLPPELK